MRKILVISFWLLAIGAWVWVLAPGELGETPEAKVTIIRVVEPDPNPYHRQYEEMLYPTVRIETPDGVGSGVVISIEYRAKSPASGGINSEEKDSKPYALRSTLYILTAAHVVGDYSAVTVTFYSCHQDTKIQSNIEATVLITDTNKDLALITLNSELIPPRDPVRGITPNYSAKLASRDYTPYLFTPVWVVGCSLGLDPRPSFGHITAITTPFNSPLTKGDLGGCWEISAPILPGNSGGPVYNAKTYEVIGIAVWVRVYSASPADRHGQLVTTMAGVVPIQTIYEFLDSVSHEDIPPYGGTGADTKNSEFTLRHQPKGVLVPLWRKSQIGNLPKAKVDNR